MLKECTDENQFGAAPGGVYNGCIVRHNQPLVQRTRRARQVHQIPPIRPLQSFYLINHNALINKLTTMGVPLPIVKWIAGFLLDREQRVKIGNFTPFSSSYDVTKFGAVSTSLSPSVYRCKNRVPFSKYLSPYFVKTSCDMNVPKFSSGSYSGPCPFYTFHTFRVHIWKL